MLITFVWRQSKKAYDVCDSCQNIRRTQNLQLIENKKNLLTSVFSEILSFLFRFGDKHFPLSPSLLIRF